MAYSISIPSCTSEVTPLEGKVIYYLVEVCMYNASGRKRARRPVMRRYRDFLELHRQLRARFDAIPEPPAKHPLSRVNERLDLIEDRRKKLETWLQRIVNDGRAQHHASVASFLELAAAEVRFLPFSSTKTP